MTDLQAEQPPESPAERHYRESVEARTAMYSKLRTFLMAEHQVSIADLTGRAEDRRRYAPLLARFVLHETKDNSAAHVNPRWLLARIDNLSMKREIDKEGYVRLRSKSEETVRRLAQYVPEIAVAQQVAEAIKAEDAQPIATDVVIALGSMKHILASRNAAIDAGENPPIPRSASA